MYKYLFFTIYRFGKYLYRVVPLEERLKQKIAGKVVLWLFKVYPAWNGSTTKQTVGASSVPEENSSFVNLCAYDVFRDRNASIVLQDMLFPETAEYAERLMIILVPYYNVMSGGIYSMFSIATEAKRMKSLHGWEVVIMTMPNSSDVTYIRNRHFTNNVDVFRFSQIIRLRKAKELYIQLPELFASSFLSEITDGEARFLESRDSVYINILNQNIRLMPEPDHLNSLKKKFPNIGQSVAHHAYFGLDFARKYRLNTMLLPAYTDLSSYLPLSLEKKDKLIIYSPDDAPYKSKCLSLIEENFPEFELIEIRDITFDKYMDLASRCLFSITFGEGMDGYLSQPILQGGIGFSVYNEEFFPSPTFLECYNIFDSEEALLKELPARMNELLSNPTLYKSLNTKLKSMHDEHYNKEDYLKRIENLCLRKYDILYDHNTGGAVFSDSETVLDSAEAFAGCRGDA